MLGKALLTLSATALIFATPLADYNHTHIFNPLWKPHAKFHTGQTITMSIVLGLATLFLTYRPDLPSSTSSPSSSSSSPPSSAAAAAAAARYLEAEKRKQSLRFAAFTGSIYWLAGLAAYFYPGASGLDPEFGGPGFPQGKLFGGLGVAAVVGGWLEGW